MCIVHLHCVLKVWQVLGRVAYCVLRIRIAYWRALGGSAYCVLCVRIVYRRLGSYWDGLRIAYCVSVLRIGELWEGVRIAYCVSVLRIGELWEGVRIAYCVSVLCTGGLGQVAYCVLCIRIVYRRFGTGCVLRIAYPYCVSEVWDRLRIVYCVSVLCIGGSTGPHMHTPSLMHQHTPCEPLGAVAPKRGFEDM